MAVNTKRPHQYEFILAWQNYRVGAVIEPSGTLRDWLLGHGYIKRIDPANETGPELEAEDAAPPKKRGRPRKVTHDAVEQPL